MCSAVLLPLAMAGLAWTGVEAWRRYRTAYLVMSMTNSECGIRVHGGPILYTQAMAMHAKLQHQYGCQRLSGFPVARHVFLLPFDKLHEIRV